VLKEADRSGQTDNFSVYELLDQAVSPCLIGLSWSLQVAQYVSTTLPFTVMSLDWSD